MGEFKGWEEEEIMAGNGKDLPGVPGNVPIIGQEPPRCTYCNSAIAGGAMALRVRGQVTFTCGECMKKVFDAVLLPAAEKAEIAGGKNATT